MVRMRHSSRWWNELMSGPLNAQLGCGCISGSTSVNPGYDLFHTRGRLRDDAFIVARVAETRCCAAGVARLLGIGTKRPAARGRRRDRYSVHIRSEIHAAREDAGRRDAFLNPIGQGG
jgi:hypothetical protein